MPIKVAFIGAGSVGFTRKLTQDLLTVPELRRRGEAARRETLAADKAAAQRKQDAAEE